MSINDYIKEDFERNHVRTLDYKIMEVFMTESEVNRRLEHNENPLLLSIEKWERISSVYKTISAYLTPYKYYNNFSKFIGYKTCALCISSKEKYISIYREYKYQEDKCKVCELAKIDRCIDEQSCYNNIVNLFEFAPHDFGKYTEKDFEQIHTDINTQITKMILNLKKIEASETQGQSIYNNI
jgi:hypothetical protein